MLLVMAVTNNNKTRFTYVSLISYKIMRCITRRLSKNSNLSSVHVSGKPLMSQVRIGNLQSVHSFIFLLKQHFFLYSPGKCWVSRASQRCQSQMLEAEKFNIVQREGGGLRKDLCKRLFLCQIKSVPNPFGQNCVTLFYCQGETPRQRFPERSGNYLAQWKKLRRLDRLLVLLYAVSIPAAKFHFDKNEKRTYQYYL